MILLEDKKQKAAAEGKEYVPETTQSWWNKIMNRASDAVPIEEEETILLDHNYDGIRELDNHLPPWWKWLFYFTIVWGIVYLFVYHVFDALPLMHEEYDIVMEDARIAREAFMASAGNNIDESNVEFSDEPQVLANGKAIYDRECVACHAPEGQGLIGPNFTDNYWIHGGSINDVFTTVKYGVPQKGMISWQSKLSPSEMRDVSSYILTFVGTTPKNPPPPKAPEGQLYTPESENQTSEEPAEQPAEI
jgi:cytochrome c oxidase cbb3-type subunit 3